MKRTSSLNRLRGGRARKRRLWIDGSRARRLLLEPLEDRRMLATFMVTGLGDEVNGNDTQVTLREAINNANGNEEADTITFASSLATGTVSKDDASGGADVEINLLVPGTVDVVADGNDVVVRSGVIELFRAPGSTLNRLDIFGTAGDDTLNVANLDAIFAGVVGGRAGTGNDTLRLTGSGQKLDLTQIADVDIQGFEAIDITGSGSSEASDGNTLTLNVAEVINISATTQTLGVKSGAGDMVTIGRDWKFAGTGVENGDFSRILTQGDSTLQLDGPFDWSYPDNSVDTNGNGSVEPLDILIILNELDDPHFSLANGQLVDAAALAVFPDFFYDVSHDGFVSPLDVLIVINFLDHLGGDAEGEAAPTHLNPFFADAVGNMPVASAADQQDDDASASLNSAGITVGPVGSSRVARYEPSPRGKSLVDEEEDADLIGAIDALFGEFGLGTLR